MLDPALAQLRTFPVVYADGRREDLPLGIVASLRRVVVPGGAVRIEVHGAAGLLAVLNLDAPVFRTVVALAGVARLPRSSEVMDDLRQHPLALPGGTVDHVRFR